MRSILVTAAVVVATGGTLVACSNEPEGPPRVTFATGEATATADPTQLCDIDVANCQADAGAAVVLRVPPGAPVDITVPDAVGDTPWLVVFGYRTGTGEQVNARSDLFAAEERTEYTLTLPAPDDQLEMIEVQQLGGTFVPDDQGGVEFPTRATWVLSVDDL